MTKSLKELLFHKHAHIKRGTGNGSIKTLINKIQKFYYSDEIKYFLLRIDNYALFQAEDTIDFFSKAHKEYQLQQLTTRIYLPYLIEKFIVYGSNNPTSNKNISIQDFHSLYNDANNLEGIDMKEGEVFSRLFFFMGHEQFALQEDDSIRRLYRFKKLFEGCQITKQISDLIFSMDLDKFLVLLYAFLAYLNKSKFTMVHVDVNNFKKFVINPHNDFSTQDIDCFINYLTISNEEFKKQYCNLRKIDGKPSNNFLNYNEQSKIDKTLPKISFFYPLYKDENTQNIYITSYTAITQFLRLDRIYYDIVENKDIDINYKSKYLGPLIENYVKNIIEQFIIKYPLQTNASVKTGKKYFIGKQEFSEPDIIFETEKSLFIIECKTSAFNLIQTLHNFSRDASSKIEHDLDVSTNNIKRYFEHRNQGNEKKVYKFLMYFNASDVMTTALKPNRFEQTDFILTSIEAIECLFRVSNDSLENILDTFIELSKKGENNSLYTTIRTRYDIDDSNEEEYFETLAKGILTI